MRVKGNSIGILDYGSHMKLDPERCVFQKKGALLELTGAEHRALQDRQVFLLLVSLLRELSYHQESFSSSQRKSSHRHDN
jgi:hypothetical protein